ncbi:MAG: integration host factor subunit beta [Chitinophagia bacterium]|nr:integration host factor subunit beta [Chitinophagia bacterium]
MTKGDIVDIINKETGIPKVDIILVVESFFKEIKSSLENGEEVYIRGFGSFGLKRKAPKMGRDMQKNIAIQIPEHYVPDYRPAADFLAYIKSIKEPFGTAKNAANESE